MRRPGEILAAAFEEFKLRGYAATRLEDVAKRAGVSKGTIYIYFQNKEELFRAALEDALESQLLSNLHAMSEVSGHFDGKWIVEAGSLLPRNPGDTGVTNAQRLLIESYYAAWRDVDARDKLLPRLKLHMQMYIDIIERAQANGDIDPSHNARALAMVMMAIPTGQSLMGLAGLERIEDSEWLPLLLGMSTALKPKK